MHVGVIWRALCNNPKQDGGRFLNSFAPVLTGISLKKVFCVTKKSKNKKREDKNE